MRHLRSLGLGVVGLQVLLEVEDLELILLSQRKELAERSIGLDDLLLHQTLGLGVGADLGGDVGAADGSTGGDAEELAEVRADPSGLGEDSLLLGLVLAINGLAAAALLGALELTRDLLLQLLHLREDSGEDRAEGVDLLNKAIELGDNVDLLRGSRGLNVGDGRSSGDGRRGGDDGGGSRSSGGGRRGSSGGLTALLGGGRGSSS